MNNSKDSLVPDHKNTHGSTDIKTLRNSLSPVAGSTQGAFTQLRVAIPTLLEEEEFLPLYMTEEAAGADIKAAIDEPLLILPGSSALIPTGIRLEIPEGFEIQVRPRSGLALKHQVTVLNAPGTIDSDYRGEVKVILINHGKENFLVERGMRIGQLVLARVIRACFTPSKELSSTARGLGGFGHTDETKA